MQAGLPPAGALELRKRGIEPIISKLQHRIARAWAPRFQSFCERSTASAGLLRLAGDEKSMSAGRCGSVRESPSNPFLALAIETDDLAGQLGRQREFDIAADFVARLALGRDR